VDACKKNGWQAFNFPTSFGNQGECVSFVNTAAKPPKMKVSATQRVEVDIPDRRDDGHVHGDELPRQR
jgi:hypothetical protein